jgi:hypothetical protein
MTPESKTTTNSTTTAEKQAHDPHAGEHSMTSKIIRSSFAMALIIFAAINAYMSFASPIHFDAFNFPYRGWAWWTMNDLRKDTAVHNVATLGSSLMVSAIAGCDANYFNKSLDLTTYHKASYLEHLLRVRFGGDFQTANLSAPGQMPSDAYLMLQAMVATANRPDVVIYGIAPRDFIDSTLACPADTEPFHFLKRLVNIDDISPVVFESPLPRLDWWLQKQVYLYGYATDFQMASTQASTTALSYLAPQPYNNPPFTWWDRVRLIPNYLPAEIHPEAVMAQPTDKPAPFRDNRLEYAQRYKNPNPHTYRNQIYFLKKIAKFCKSEGIELVVVNMPITLYNVAMLPPGVYMRYLQDMREFAANNTVTFYDLADFNHYQIADFNDSVHLNAFGGKKFFDNLVDALSQDRRASSMLTLAGEVLEKHKALAEDPKLLAKHSTY